MGMGSKKIIGIDIGGTKSAVILGTEAGLILDKAAFATEVDSGKDKTINRILLEIKNILVGNGLEHDEIKCIGISCGGPLDREEGIIYSPPNLPGWDEVHITEIISEATGIESYLENDANSSALAEWKFGAGQGYKNLIFLTFGTGLGAGLILNGDLYRGGNGLAGEIGHIRLTDGGPVGYNKAGSFEGYCSGGGIANLAGLILEKKGLNEAFGKSLPEITARDVGLAAATGDKLAREILAESGKYLGRGLSILIDIFNPEIIIIGGIYVRCQEFLEHYAREAIKQEALTETRRNCEIKPAKLGEQIGDYAALSVAMM